MRAVSLKHLDKFNESSSARINLLKILAGGNIIISILCVIMGCLILAFNKIEYYLVPVLFILIVGLMTLFFLARRYHKSQPGILITAFAGLISMILVMALPDFIQAANIHGIIHRSFIAGLLMVATSVPGLCYSLYHWFGATPRAFDLSRYPLFLLPAVLALIAFGLIIYYVAHGAALNFNWSVFVTPFKDQSYMLETWQDGWPTISTVTLKQSGILNHILGTLLLMGLTTLLSLPIGVAVGVYITQYAGPRMAGMVNYATTVLRSVSGVILLVTAMSLLLLPDQGSLLYNLFHGFGYNLNGTLMLGKSSFLFSSMFISLLVIPLIARATQEGLNSLPKDIQEGSIAIGVSKEHTLFHIQLPWSFPNIITALLLGCAEAAGALSVIFLIAGTGDFGVGLFNETTSLAYLIFNSTRLFSGMVPYKYSAALVLLIITLGLTTTTLIMKRNLAKRYKGA